MKKLAKSAVYVAILMVLAKVLGLVKEVILAHQFGTSYIVDAYTIACSLPTVLFAIFASGFSNSYLPVYVRIEDEKDKNRFFCNTITLLTIISFVFTAICIVFSKQFTSILAPGFDEKSAALTNDFIKLISLYLPFFTVFNIFTAHMSAREDFTAAQFCDTIVCNIVIIIFTCIATPKTPYLLVIGYILSMAVASLVAYIYMTRKKYIKFRPVISVKDDSFRTLVAIAIPMGLSSLVGQLNSVIDRMFSTSLGSGVTSALGYAHRVELLPYSFVASIFLTLCRPRMNTCFAKGDNDGGMVYAKRAFLIVMFASIPLVVGFLIFSTPIIKLIFERGAFNSESTRMTAACLVFYALGMPFFATRDVISTVLSANYKQKWVLYNTIFVVVSNVALNFALIGPMGYKGLALATSLSGLLSSVFMLLMLKRMKLNLIKRSEVVEVLKMIACTGFSMLVGWGVFESLKSIVDDRILVVFCILLIIAIYFAFSVIFNVKILKWIYSYLPSKLRIIRKWNEKKAA